MKPKVYVETSIISYLTARDSRDVVTLAKQRQTREWWTEARPHYTLFIGQPVMDEIGEGDPDARVLRQDAVKSLPVLPLDEDARRLARALMAARLLPPKATLDAYHLCLAAIHGMDFLLTWNCKHLNNPHTKGAMSDLVARAGFQPPVITDPETLGRPRP